MGKILLLAGQVIVLLFKAPVPTAGLSCFDNIKYTGNNIIDISQPSHLACQKTCYDKSGCEFWTWSKLTHMCYLKHRKGNVTPDSSYVSGSKNCQLPEAIGK